MAALKGYFHVVKKDEMAEFDPRRTWYFPLGVLLSQTSLEKCNEI